MPEHEPRDPDAESQICCACGLCCAGLLHVRAELAPAELATFRAAGFEAYPWCDRFAFPLPCAKLDDTRCGVYRHRPAVCHGFRCRLLRDFAAGALSIADCVRVVRRGRELWQLVLVGVGATPSQSLWPAVARYTAALGAAEPPPALGLHTAALLTLIRLRFADAGFTPPRDPAAEAPPARPIED